MGSVGKALSHYQESAQRRALKQKLPVRRSPAPGSSGHIPCAYRAILTDSVQEQYGLD